MTNTVNLLTTESATGALEPPQPPPHSSWSGISDASRCGKLYQLKRVLGLPEDPMMAAVAGRAVHAAIEAYNRMRFAELGR